MIKSLYQHRILPKQYITQAVDVETSINIMMKVKNLDYAFVLPFSFTILVNILDICIQRKTNSSSSEITLFTKRSFSRTGSSNVTSYYTIVFSPFKQCTMITVLAKCRSYAMFC